MRAPQDDVRRRPVFHAMNYRTRLNFARWNAD
jgi:hypothetical protein